MGCWLSLWFDCCWFICVSVLCFWYAQLLSDKTKCKYGIRFHDLMLIPKDCCFVLVPPGSFSCKTPRNDHFPLAFPWGHLYSNWGLMFVTGTRKNLSGKALIFEINWSYNWSLLCKIVVHWSKRNTGGGGFPSLYTDLPCC